MGIWYEDDRFWQVFHATLFDATRLASAQDEVDAVIALLGLTPGARVLDMPCGVGRHSIALAKRGMVVCGVDRTAEYLERAGRSAAEAGVRLELVRADMREFQRAGAFDAAVSLYTSLGYFEDFESDRRILRNYFESLAPGGRLIVDVMGKEVLARIYTEKTWVELPDKSLFLSQTTIQNDWKWVHNRWIRIDEGGRSEWAVGLRVFSAAELHDLLASVGFAIERTIGSLAGIPYDNKAERLIVVVKKPG